MAPFFLLVHHLFALFSFCVCGVVFMNACVYACVCRFHIVLSDVFQEAHCCHLDHSNEAVNFIGGTVTLTVSSISLP
jgi:hypothetical protein